MTIQDIMTAPVVTCRDTDTLNTAAQLMWEHDCGAIPVTNEAGRVVGIVTDRDICMATYTKGCAPGDIGVAEVMTAQVAWCHPDESLQDVERMMGERQVRRIPVVDSDQRPVGIVSLNDVARYAATTPQKNGLDRDLTRTLAAICRPRAQQPRRRVRAAT